MDIDNDDIGFDVEAEGRQRQRGFRNSHLDSPLDLEYLTRIGDLARRHQELARWKHTVDPISLISRTVQWAMSFSYPAHRPQPEVAYKKIRAELATLGAFAGATIHEPKCPPNPIVESLGSLAMDLEDFSKRTCLPEAGVIKKDFIGFTLTHCAGYVWLTRGIDSSILSYDLFLMLKDVLTARSLVLESIHVERCFTGDSTVKMDEIVPIWQWGDSLISKIGNPAYDLIKNYEALVTARLVLLLTVDASIAGGSTFQDETRATFIEDSKERGCPEANEIFNILDSLSGEDKLNELAGLYKTWGHPVVDVVAGIAANRKVSQKVKPPPDQHVVDDLVLRFRQMMVEGYYKKHGKHMSMSVDGMAEGNPVREAVLRGSPVPTTVKLDSYRNLQFEQTFEIDTISATDVIHDKALGPDLNELKECLHSQNKTKIEHRRTLLRFLSENYPSLPDLLRQMDKDGVPMEARVLGVTPKERELKTKARLFSLIPMLLKFYFGGTEKLIADHILPYLPQITMKDDLRDLLGKMISITSLGKPGSGYTNVATHIDFEKWNMNFRDDLVRPILSEIDHLFGFSGGLISKTHEIFETIQYHCHDGKHWPSISPEGEIEPGDLAWLGQYGGVEGLRQKGWSIVTILIILHSTEGSSAEFSLTGQGDNQVLVAHYPLPQTGSLKDQSVGVRAKIASDVKRWQARLYDTAEKVGMPIKPTESWSSTEIYSYGKNTYVHGRPLSAKYKRISRMFVSTNDLHPSLYNAVVSIHANGQAASYQSPSPLIGYIMATIQTERCIESFVDYHPGVKGGHVTPPPSPAPAASYQPSEQLMYGSAVVGGYPVQHLNGYLCLGGPDNLSDYLAWMRLLRSHVDPKVGILLTNWSNPIKSNKPGDVSMLIQDPQSGNFLSGTLPLNYVKRTVQEWMQSGNVKNTAVLSLLKVQEVDGRAFSEALSGEPDLNPLLMSLLASSTPSEFAREFVGRFDNASSVRSVASALNVGFRGRMEQFELSFYHAALRQASAPGTMSCPTCPTLHASKLRDESWGRRIQSVTAPSLFGLLQPSAPGSLGDVVMTISASSNNDLLTLHGSYPPYLGSRGERPVQQHNDYTSVDSEKILQRVIKLRRTLGAMVPKTDPSMVWAERLWESVTDLPYAALSPSENEDLSSPLAFLRSMLTTGGSLSHHYTTSTHTWVGLPLGSSLSKGTFLSKSTHFPSIVLGLNAMLSILASLGLPIGYTMSWSAICADCVLPLEVKLSGPRSLLGLSPTRMSGESGLWVSKASAIRRLVRLGGRRVDLIRHPAVAREETLSVCCALIASRLLSRPGGQLVDSIRDLRWITINELADGVFTWIGRLTLSSSTFTGRSHTIRRHDWDREIRGTIARIPAERFSALCVELTASGAFFDRAISSTAILDGCYPNREVDGERLKGICLSGNSCLLPLVAISSKLSDLLAQAVASSGWGQNSGVLPGYIHALSRCSEIEKDGELNPTLSIYQLLDSDVDSMIPLNWVQSSRKIIVDTLQSYWVNPSLSDFHDYPAPRETAPPPDIVLDVGRVDFVDVDVSRSPALVDNLSLSRVDREMVDDSGLTQDWGTQFVQATLMAVRSRSGDTVLESWGWGATEWVLAGRELGLTMTGVEYSPIVHRREGVAFSTGVDQMLQSPTATTVFVMPGDASMTGVLKLIQDALTTFSKPIYFVLPFWTSCHAGVISSVCRFYYKRSRVFTITGSLPVAWYVIAAEIGPVTYRIPVNLFVTTSGLAWPVAIRGSSGFDHHSLGWEDCTGVCLSLLGGITPASPEDLIQLFEEWSLDGLDLPRHIPGIGSKRYRGSRVVPFDPSDVALKYLAARDAVGLQFLAGLGASFEPKDGRGVIRAAFSGPYVFRTFQTRWRSTRSYRVVYQGFCQLLERVVPPVQDTDSDQSADEAGWIRGYGVPYGYDGWVSD